MEELMRKTTKVMFHVTISEDSDGSYWAKVDELPGCFASGFSIDEIKESTFDAIQLWLPDGIELGDPEWAFVEGDRPQTEPARRQPKRQKALVCA